jgi:CubicO group peptidase (beta-lactamase class C family)
MVLRINRTPALLFLIGVLALSSCHVGRFIYYNFADIDDYKKFPQDTLQNAPPLYHFEYSGNYYKINLPKTFQTKEESISFEDFLKSKHTKAFLIIRNDSIVYEKYFDGTDHSTIFPGFSITKSFLSALVGIAIDEGYIKSIKQPVMDFLPELKDEKFQKVTIEDLLNMRSGIRFAERYSNPFGGMAKFYYGRNLRKYTLNLKIKSEPGKAYKYQSANSQLLTMVVEKATGKRISEYLEEKIWKQAGMEYIGIWNVDSKKFRENKGFCCINARSVDFAKFGQLYLNNGNMNNRQVVPENWVRESLQIRNDSRDSQGFPYTYSWRVLENGDFFAKGILGEFIYICPVKKIILVRIGDKSTDLVWPDLFLEILKQL